MSKVCYQIEQNSGYFQLIIKEERLIRRTNKLYSPRYSYLRRVVQNPEFEFRDAKYALPDTKCVLCACWLAVKDVKMVDIFETLLRFASFLESVPWCLVSVDLIVGYSPSITYAQRYVRFKIISRCLYLELPPQKPHQNRQPSGRCTSLRQHQCRPP